MFGEVKSAIKNMTGECCTNGKINVYGVAMLLIFFCIAISIAVTVAGIVLTCIPRGLPRVHIRESLKTGGFQV